MPSGEDRFDSWFEALEARHLSRLTFAEVRRGLQALSALYVDRGKRPGTGGALGGSGKRGAFALFYAPLHFLLVGGGVGPLGAGGAGPRRLVGAGGGPG